MRAWPAQKDRGGQHESVSHESVSSCGFARVGFVMWFRTSRFRHVVSHESVSHKHRARRPSVDGVLRRPNGRVIVSRYPPLIFTASVVGVAQSPLCAVDARRTSVSVTPRGHRRVARPDETSSSTARARGAAPRMHGHGARARTARPPLNGLCDAISDRFVRCVGRETRDPAAASRVRWAHRVRVVSYYRTYLI